MKNLKYLIPLIVLTSCIGTKEVYDDVYSKVEVVQPEVKANEDLGYADYVKNSESKYQVEVDSSAFQSNNASYMNGYNSYNTNSGDINIYNNSNDYGRYNNGPAPWSDYSVYYTNNYYWGFNNYSYSPWGWRYRPYRNCIGFGYGYGNFYGYNGGWHSPYYGWNIPYYGPYGHGFYDPYFMGYGHPYYGYGYGYGYFGNGYYSNPYGGGDGGHVVASNNNHHYGHRRSATSTSSNTSTYEHTVMSQVDQPKGSSKPFDAYSSAKATVAKNPNFVSSTVEKKEKPSNTFNGAQVLEGDKGLSGKVDGRTVKGSGNTVYNDYTSTKVNRTNAAASNNTTNSRNEGNNFMHLGAESTGTNTGINGTTRNENFRPTNSATSNNNISAKPATNRFSSNSGVNQSYSGYSQPKTGTNGVSTAKKYTRTNGTSNGNQNYRSNSTSRSNSNTYSKPSSTNRSSNTRTYNTSNSNRNTNATYQNRSSSSSRSSSTRSSSSSSSRSSSTSRRR
ncbi:hypothetical protein [Crocinitomix algicola]|uniref:hypothetical protein n=1 Tax=Crocinitomix algicola TaxID=1740263 RepID=UPI0008362B5B|nr:hypothetical protein [Crocinitomix algicola]